MSAAGGASWRREPVRVDGSAEAKWRIRLVTAAGIKTVNGDRQSRVDRVRADTTEGLVESADPGEHGSRKATMTT